MLTNKKNIFTLNTYLAILFVFIYCSILFLGSLVNYYTYKNSLKEKLTIIDNIVAPLVIDLVEFEGYDAKIDLNIILRNYPGIKSLVIFDNNGQVMHRYFSDISIAFQSYYQPFREKGEMHFESGDFYYNNPVIYEK